MSRASDPPPANLSENCCAICLDAMEPKGGRALFTAECSHTFHFQCIASNVQHGNRTCPLCVVTWKQLPFEVPPPHRSRPRKRYVAAPEPLGLYDDDEPLDPQSETVASESRNGTVDTDTFLEFPAIKRSASLEDFSVLIHLKAPSLPALNSPESDSDRAAVDIVAVLDVSGSMSGSKITLLKQAMTFVIQNLAPCDRLSIVSFSSNAHRLFHLRRMTESGRGHALQAVNSLSADGHTDIAQGLKMGAKVLEDRLQKNPVCSIIFLSDGQDTGTLARSLSDPSEPNGYMSLLPTSIVGGSATHRTPVHAFGFGTDHDAALMHSISEASGGTFSFVETPEMIQDAFAQCIGGLLSVVVQQMCVKFRCLHPDIHINSISSGSYNSQVMDGRKSGLIQVGDMYAYEERDFLVSINLPSGDEAALLKVSCTYIEPVSGRAIHLDDMEVKVPRPDEVMPEECVTSVEVQRHKKRFHAAATVGAAQAAADEGNLDEAISILSNFRERTIKFGQFMDEMDVEMDGEMEEMQGRMGNWNSYNTRGRAYMMSNKTSNLQQRASARSSLLCSERSVGEPASGITTTGPAFVKCFQSPIMLEMVRRSSFQRAQGGPSSRDPPPPPGRKSKR